MSLQIEEFILRKSKRGFTLIEVLLAVVIIAILATIAVPLVSGVMNNANHSVDNANAGLYESALKIYVSQKAQQRQYVDISQQPGSQNLVANSIAKIINDGPIEFKCNTKSWVFYYNPVTLQVVAMEYQDWFIPGTGMIAFTDNSGVPITGNPLEDVLQ